MGSFWSWLELNQLMSGTQKVLAVVLCSSIKTVQNLENCMQN